MLGKRNSKKSSLGFLLYWKEWLDKHDRVTVEKARTECLPIWNNLSKTKREEYNKRAEQETGIQEVIDIRRAVDAQREDEKKERDAVYFDNMTFWMSGVLLEPDWEDHMFLLLSVSYFNVKSDESIFPAELAIAKFNLRGMLETRHLRINPGKLPSGSEAEAKASASETHNLPIPPNCEGESDWNRIYEKIKEFVGVGPSTNFFVNAAKGDLSAASRTLEFIWKTSLDFNQSTHPRAFALEHLVFELQANAAAVYNMIPYSNKQEACEVMQKRPHTFPHFEANKITGCSFHQKEDVTAFCALTRVKEWVFKIWSVCGVNQREADSQQSTEHRVNDFYHQGPIHGAQQSSSIWSSI